MNLCAILMIGRRGEVERMGDKIMFCQRDVFISHFNGACDVVIVHTKLKPHANQKKMYELYSNCLIFLSSQFTIPLICCCLRFFGCTKKIYFKSWCWIVTKWKHCANTLELIIVQMLHCTSAMSYYNNASEIAASATIHL